jgi:hypothetical protein
VLVHPDNVPRVADRYAWRNRTADDLSKYVLTANEHEIGRTALFSIQQSAPDDFVRGVVAAHSIDGDLHWPAALLKPASASP